MRLQLAHSSLQVSSHSFSSGIRMRQAIKKPGHYTVRHTYIISTRWDHYLFKGMISAQSLQRDTKKAIEAGKKRKGDQKKTEINRQQTTIAVWDGGRGEKEPSISIANNGRQACGG